MPTLGKTSVVSETTTIKNQMEDILASKFNIGHLTVQFEYGTCDDKKIIHQL